MRVVWKARRNFQSELKGYIRKREQVVGANIDRLLEAGRVKEYWYNLVRWYPQVRGRQDHPTREGLDQVSVDREELYRCRLPEGLQVPLLVQPLAVNNDIPTEAEI